MPITEATLKAYAKKRKEWTYHGPCRVPGCNKANHIRGVCKYHYQEIGKGPKQFGKTAMARMKELGIVLRPQLPGLPFVDPGVSINIPNLPENEWLPRTAALVLGREIVRPKNRTAHCTAPWMRRVQECGSEWEAAQTFANEISWDQFPHEIKDQFGELTCLELSNLAWQPCRTKVEHEVKVFILHLRVLFGFNFTGLGGSGIFHPDDYRDNEDEQAILAPCLNGFFKADTEEDFRCDDMDDGE